MKKIFQIASYDFKRLILNPFSLVTMLVVLVGCLILGATYKIPAVPEYSAVVSGQTTHEIFQGFNSSSPQLDTKTSLNAILDEAKNYIFVQKTCQDFATLTNINNNFVDIKYELEKYKIDPQHSVYIEQNNIDEIHSAVNSLKNFVEYFKDLEEFESNVFFLEESFANLESICQQFENILADNADIATKLNQLLSNLSHFELLNTIITSQVHRFDIDRGELERFESEYIAKAEAKRDKIYEEMVSIASMVSGSDVTYADSMTRLITNYKLTLESAKMGIASEAYLVLNNFAKNDKHLKSLKNLYHYHPIVPEETKLAITKINFFLNDESLYYTNYQIPLNFNTASAQITAYDNTHFLMSIIGFFTIIFGIFCAYKLFGQDRRNGKMDIILSQDVRFGQVFAAKFLAIVLSTVFILGVFLFFNFIWSLIFHTIATEGILAVFNLSSPYTIHPFLFMLIKVIGIEFQVVFYVVITIFLMNISRKFEITFAVALVLFAAATVCNIFLNGFLAYCLFPFIHADITAFLGGGTMTGGFLQTKLYAHGNFFISLVYYTIVVGLLYNFTKQLFKKN